MSDNIFLIYIEGEQQEDNLEIAWEALEAARVLYMRQEEFLKVSDVHLDLGTVALESGMSPNLFFSFRNSSMFGFLEI